MSKRLPKQELLVSDTVHSWFGLSYANYLVWPRSVLQSMPSKWQTKFVALATELADAISQDAFGEYWVRRTSGRRFVHDPYADYRHVRHELRVASR